jgi:hypothetical protein
MERRQFRRRPGRVDFIKATSTCLKGCGKGVNVSAKGIGKKMLKDCTDAAKAQAATDALAKKV